MSGGHHASHRAAGDQTHHLHGSAAALDCTTECRLERHSETALCCAYLGNIKLLQHCQSICGNPFAITDGFGRNVLHVAASRGHLHLVHWLLTRRRVAVNVADWESRWSALHRSVFYGHLGVGVYLVKSGGDLTAKDGDGYTPLSILNEDRERFKSSLSVIGTSVHTWGSNSNVTLGHDHSRNHPERLDLSGAYSVSQVVLCKFHSVFLTECGHVLTCGHGPGGRLGHDSEQSVVAPSPVKALSTFHCISIAAARDHTVILTKNGLVFTCGLNDAHQLGHGSNPSNAPPNYLAPKQIKAIKSRVLLIGVGRYHTAMCTSSELYTVGKNLGQLGYEKTYDTQILPHTVAGINLDQSDSIVHMSTSDSATALMTKKHRIFVCTDFTVKSIRCGFFEKISCVQFSVCASLHDLDYLRNVETEPTKLLMLDSDHKIWCWEPNKRGSVPSIMPGLAKLNVTQFYLGKSLTVVTEWGEVYSGQASVGKSLVLRRLPNIQNAKAVFTDFKTNNLAYIQQLYKSPFLPELSPSSITSDLTDMLEEACLPGGVSDVAIQAGGQYFPTHKFILASASPQFSAHMPAMSSSVQDSQLNDSVDTIEMNCNSPLVAEAFLHYVYGAHIKLIPPNVSHTSGHTGLGNGLPGTGSASSLDPETTPDTSFNASVDENDLTGIYDQFFARSYSNEFADIEIPRTVLKSTPKKKSVADSLLRNNSCGPDVAMKELHLADTKADLNSLLGLATKFGMKELKTRLESILRSLSMKKLSKLVILVRPKLELKFQPQFSDLSLISEEGESIPCHRCVLVARSEYFRSMLLMGWRESSENSKSLSLPVRYKVLKAVIEYIYTDECPALVESASLEWVCSVLVIADQLLLMRLKNLCEKALAKALTLRNVVEFLEFAEAYCADQLKKSCLQFICVNAACFLEGRYLDYLEDSRLNELSAAYLSMVPKISERVFKFRDPDMGSLPESYFLDVDDNSGHSLSDDEEQRQQSTPNGRTRTDSGSFSRTPSTQDIISPRVAVSSGSRRRRRRKNSQSDSRKQSSGVISPIPHCVSPVDTTPRSGTISEEQVSKTADKDSPELFSPVSDGRRSPNKISNGDRPNSSGKRDKARTRLLNRFETAGSQESGDEVHAPSSSYEMANGVAMAKEPAESPEKPTCVMSVVQPVPTGRSAKGGWANLPKISASTGTSLREIMANEEKEKQLKKQRKQIKQQKSPPPTAQVKEYQAKSGRSGSMSIGSTQPLLVPEQRRYSQQDSPAASPSTAALSPTFNPWKTTSSASLGASPPVSMRKVMAEAEAEQKRRQNQERHKVVVRAGEGAHKANGEKVMRRVPPSIPHQQVSFASILRAQKMEEQQSRVNPRKNLTLIQIEERAISELEDLYSAKGNPDEFITVERCMPTSKLVYSNRPVYRSQHCQESPWGKDQAIM